MNYLEVCNALNDFLFPLTVKNRHTPAYMAHLEACKRDKPAPLFEDAETSIEQRIENIRREVFGVEKSC